MSDVQALTILMRSPVTQEMIQYIVSSTLKVIKCKKSKTGLPSPPASPSSKVHKQIPSLMTFISKLVRYTNVYSGTLLATLVYLEKLASKLPKNAEGLSTTLHRIFLACLIISSKFNNDSSPKNSHWADFTDGLFTVDDINLMERQLLNLLNWDVQVSNADLSRCLRVFIEPIKNDLKNAQRMRRSKPKSQLQSSPQQQQSSIRPPLQSPPISPVSYKDVMHTHQRSASVASTSSLSSSSSFSSIESISETDYKLNAVPVAKPILLYQPNSIKNVIEPAHSFKFDQRELENYVTYL